MQNEVILAIVREIEVSLTHEEEKRITYRKPIAPKAYEAYLRGIFFMEKHTPEGYRTAAMHFSQAIEIQPDYAQAHAWLGGAYWVPSLWGYTPPHESFSKAKASVNKAVELDNTCAEALGGIGWISLHFDWDWETAKKSLEGALELNPNFSYGYHGLAWYWAFMGHFEQAIDAMQSAIGLDPLSHVFHCTLATIYGCSGQSDKAVGQRNKALELAPHFVTALVQKAEYFLSISKYQEAMHVIGDTMNLTGRTPRLVSMLGRAYALSDMRDQAETLLRELGDMERNAYISALHFALLYVSLNRWDDAFHWLDRAYEERNPMMSFLKINPAWKPIHSDPRFGRFLKKMNLSE
jgi:tetratricopeptide (TPR) repeat protein